MSDQDVVSALDALELLLEGGSLDGEAIALWREGFDTAVAGAERGSGWPGTVARAHALSGRLDAVAKIYSAQKDELRKELDLHAQGARALKGYKPS